MKQKIVLSIAVVFMSLSIGMAKDTSKEPVSGNSMNAQVSGLVIDKKTGEFLAGVLVKIEEVNQEVYTNFEGKFEFNNLKSGNYSLSCNLITYQNLKIEDVAVESSVTKNDITLELSPVEGNMLIK
jgi:hypothetical protein